MDIRPAMHRQACVASVCRLPFIQVSMVKSRLTIEHAAAEKSHPDAKAEGEQKAA
jgi:hypothetical protein